MSPLESLFSRPTIMALGCALVHHLWQGAGVALLLAASNTWLRNRAPQLRYAAACAAMLLLLVLPVLTLLLLLPVSTSADVPLAGPDSAATGMPGNLLWPSEAASLAPPSAGPGLLNGLCLYLEPTLPWVVAFWLAGSLALSLRFLGSWLYLQFLWRWRASPVHGTWQKTMSRLQQTLGCRASVRLRESAWVRTPLTMGWLRPVVLLPLGVLTGLTPQQVEALLVHELAHIRRHDYLVNLLQAICETVFFYHPATWWISKRVRSEREFCCDDLTVSVCGNGRVYARALALLEEWGATPPSPALAAAVHPLVVRIGRILAGSSPHTTTSRRRFYDMALVSSALIAALTAFGLILASVSPVPAQQADYPLHFADDFDDNDVSDWSVGPSGVWPAVVNGQTWGKGQGYGGTQGACMIHEIALDGSDGFAVEFRARSGASPAPTAATIWLRSPDNYVHLFHVYGESSFHQIYFEYSTPSGQGQIRYPASWNLDAWHTYRFERDGAGNWRVFVDGAMVWSFAADADLSHFATVELTPASNMDAFDWVKLYGQSISPPNSPPAADAGTDQEADCTSAGGAAVQLDGTGSADPDGDALTYLWEAPGITFDDPTSIQPTARFPLGATEVTLTVDDGNGGSDTDEVVVSVVDAVPPEIAVVATPALLWPPNHDMVDVDVAVQATDACGGPAIRLTSVVSSEPDNGLGDGDRPEDVQGADIGTEDYALQVRAERSGSGLGRVYTLTYTATDIAGNSSTATAEVIVPRDQGKRTGAGKGLTARNSPNPFNPTTTIGYFLPQASPVRLTIYNMLGQEVRVLVDAPQNAGPHTALWDGTDQSGTPVTGGVYLYLLQSGSEAATGRMVLAR